MDRLNWRKVEHSEAMRFVIDNGGVRRAERQAGDTPYAWTMTYYLANDTVLRVTHPSMDASAPARYDIGEP